MTVPMRRPALLLLIAAVLAGCGAFKRAPVIEERVSDFGIPKIGVLATTGERRAVIVKMPDRLICAEPPPDVAEAVAAAVSGALEATSKSAAELRLGASSALSTALLQLTYRTQGLQLYRDGSFFLCTLYMNQIISEAEYLAARHELLDDSIELIRMEIPLIAEIRKAQSTVTVAAPGAAATATAASGPSTAASVPGR